MSLTVWNAYEVKAATSGHWLGDPAPDWSASGLCIAGQTYMPGNMLAIQLRKGDRGVSVSWLRKMRDNKPSALIVSENFPELKSFGIPVLLVSDTGKAVLDLGRYARNRFAGTVFGITGSAGKTTCSAMLSHALSLYDKTAVSAHNANLPHGIAWNLASFDSSAAHLVLEMAVGKMAISSRMARPNVAIFTNIQPAHLGATDTMRDIAKTKGAIFVGMQPGSLAILNRDMLEWETVHAAAVKARLRIIHYGTADNCDYRLIDYNSDNQSVTARTPNGSREFVVGAAGRHMALNSLAVVAAIESVGLSDTAGIGSLASFGALAGRGQDFQIVLSGQHLKIIDDAYNANPGSMAAALSRLSDEKGAGRRIAVLGQMAELGKLEEQYHTALSGQINSQAIDRVYAVGPLYAKFWQALSPERRGHHAMHLSELEQPLIGELRSGDTVLFKGSNSTKLHTVVEKLKKSRIESKELEYPKA